MSVAAFGECLASAGRLAEAARGDVAALLTLPGSFHVVTSGPAGVMAAGDAAGFRRLFTTRFARLPIIASHADVLRRLNGAEVNPAWLASRLASPDMPSVLREALSPFTGIEPIPPGCRIEITGSSCQVRRWWTPPTPDHPISQGAEEFRDALTAAVDGRLDQAHDPVSVQLSGGYDSTVLAAMAAPARPLLVTTAGRSPVDEDLKWARQIAEHFPGKPHSAGHRNGLGYDVRVPAI